MTSSIQSAKEFSKEYRTLPRQHETDEDQEDVEEGKREIERDVLDSPRTKKHSAMESMRNFLRSNASTANVNDLYVSNYNLEQVDRSGKSTDYPKENRTRKKLKHKLVRHGKGRKRRPSLAIQNEGASLWIPKENCCWKSVGGRTVRLEEIGLKDLCEAERLTLQQLASRLLQQNNLCTITIPKEKRVNPSRRWKALLPLLRNYRGVTTEEKAPVREKMVFAVDLSQVIENDKAAERADQIKKAKLMDIHKKSEEEEIEEQHIKDLFHRRSSDPTVNSSSTKEDFCDVPDYLLTFPVIRQEKRNMRRHRKSRLIEALTLSSTSASSVCVLDKDSEFKPPEPQVPRIILDTVDFINKYALKTMYIFRNEGSKKRVKQMKAEYEKGENDIITSESHPPDVSALFKDFLRNLPEPLLTRELYDAFISIGNINDTEEYYRLLKYLIWLLPVANRDTLQVVLQCLKNVADNSREYYDEEGNLVPGNRMDAGNIAIVMAPNILYRIKGYKSTSTSQIEEETQTTIDIIEDLILLHEELFVIERDVHDEILRKVLESDPETVDYVLRKKSTRTSLCDVLETFDDVTSQLCRRPSSARFRKISKEEKEIQKSQSFNSGNNKPTKRRHLSSITRPDFNKLNLLDKPGFSKLSRNILRMSLGSRELGSKYSPLSSPRNSLARKKLTHQDSIDGDRTPLSRKSSNLSVPKNIGDADSNDSLTPEEDNLFYKESPLSRHKQKQESAAKDRVRKISLPIFLQATTRSTGDAPIKTSSMDDGREIRKISEIMDDTDKDGCSSMESGFVSQSGLCSHNDSIESECINSSGASDLTENQSTAENSNEYWMNWHISLPKNIPPDFASVETRL